MDLTLKASDLKTYLNRALIFLNKSKMGIQPIFTCILIKEDKAHVYNGESGAVISLPFRLDSPVLFYPDTLSKILDKTADDSQVVLKFDLKNMALKVKTDDIKITIKMLDPKEWPDMPIPEHEKIEIEGFLPKVKAAAFSTSEDASLTLMQGVKVCNGSVIATDQRGVWREEAVSSKEFVISKLLIEHIVKIGLEPSNIGICDTQIFVYYPDMLIFGIRLQEEEKFPDVNKVLIALKDQPNTATVRYDREAFASKLERLLILPGQDAAIKITCANGIISVINLADSAEVSGIIEMDVSSDAEFDNVIINGAIFKQAVDRFSRMEVKADNRRVVFSNETQIYGISRRVA